MQAESNYVEGFTKVRNEGQNSLLRTLTEFGLNPNDWVIDGESRRDIERNRCIPDPGVTLVYFSKIGDSEIKLKATTKRDTTAPQILSLDLIFDLEGA